MKIATAIGSVVMIAIWLFFIVLLGYAFPRHDQIFLIPQNYQGALMLLEDPVALDSVEVNGDGFLYDFRKAHNFNGILILPLRGEFIKSGGFYKYYYVDSMGSRNKILDSPSSEEKVDSNQVYMDNSITGRSVGGRNPLYQFYMDSASTQKCEGRGPLVLYNTTIIASLKNRYYYYGLARRTEDSLFSKTCWPLPPK